MEVERIELKVKSETTELKEKYPDTNEKSLIKTIVELMEKVEAFVDMTGIEKKAQVLAEIKMILGGRYQEGTTTGEMMGMPFEGRSTLAYDNITNEYISTWIDNMGTGLAVMRGKYDEASKTTSLTGTMVDPISGKEKQMKQVYTVIDDNTRKLQMFEVGPEGEETINMEIVMKRA